MPKFEGSVQVLGFANVIVEAATAEEAKLLLEEDVDCYIAGSVSALQFTAFEHPLKEMVENADEATGDDA